MFNILATLLLLLQAQFVPVHPTNFLTDSAHVVTIEQVAEINSTLAGVKDLGMVIGVAILPTIGDYTPNDIATYIGRTWGVSDTGAIGTSTRMAGATILIVPKTAEVKGQCYIAPAKGSQGYLTDLHSAAICREMIPYFKEGRYADGIFYGIAAIQQLHTKATVLPDTSTVVATHSYSIVWFISGLVIFITVLTLVMIKQRRKEKQALVDAEADENKRLTLHRAYTAQITQAPRIAARKQPKKEESDSMLPIIAAAIITNTHDDVSSYSNRSSNYESPSSSSFDFGGSSDSSSSSSYDGGGGGDSW